MTSRFFKKVAPLLATATAPVVAPVSRFLARHRTINRIVRKVPIVTKFLDFFVVDELTLDPPKPQPEAAPHIAPVYNAKARRPKGFTLG